MGKRKKSDEPEDGPTYDVTVWNTMNGDIVKKLWSASQAELDELQEQFEDEPFCDVQIEEV